MENQCAICCDAYLIPRLLNCLHYFCQCCIESVQTNNRISCSKCGEETTFSSVRALPYHPLYFHTANSTTKERVCSVCNLPATMFCVDCDDDYCTACCKVHEKMKVTRNHMLQPTNCNPKLTCELHATQILNFFCLECESLLCSQCNACDQKGHHIVTTTDAYKSLRDKLIQGDVLKLNKLLDSLEVVKNGYKLQKREEKEHCVKLKHQVHQKTNYIISMLQSREKMVCEQIDAAVENNTSLIDTKIDSTERSMEKVSSFLKICEEWSKMPVENALLQLKPLLDQRLSKIMEESRIKKTENLKLDFISWEDQNSLLILPLIEEFGNVQITKTSLSACKSIPKKWNHEFQIPMNVSSSGMDEFVLVAESRWKVNKQKIVIQKMSLEEKVIEDIWACSKSCQSQFDMASPVITSDGDAMIGVGVGHEVILVNRTTKKSYKFGKLGSYPGQLENISSLAFSSVGNILVADNVLNRVSMFSSEGDFILCFGTTRKDGTANEHSLSNPSDLAIDTKDHVYVADTKNNRIAVFNHEGCYLKNIGCKGTKLSEFDKPIALALSNTVLSVLDKGNRRIQFICVVNDNDVIGYLNLGHIPDPRNLVWIRSGSSHDKQDLSGDILVTDSHSVFHTNLCVE